MAPTHVGRCPVLAQGPAGDSVRERGLAWLGPGGPHTRPEMDAMVRSGWSVARSVLRLAGPLEGRARAIR